MRLPILENETIYGWITRYHLKVGIGHPKSTLLNLLDSNKVRIHPYLPNHLSALAKNTMTNSDFWLRGHTLYPLFEFFNREDAKKLEVKKAVEMMFSVEVDNVRLLNVNGKLKRQGRTYGKTKDWKKAYVRLKEGFDISYGEAEAKS